MSFMLYMNAPPIHRSQPEKICVQATVGLDGASALGKKRGSVTYVPLCAPPGESTFRLYLNAQALALVSQREVVKAL